MPRLQANPDVEAQLDFDVVAPGTYRMRVKSIEEVESKATPGNMLWKLVAEYCDSGLMTLDNKEAKNPGTIIDNGLVVYPTDKQWKTRSLVEACGREWSDLDSEDLIGSEFDAKIGTDTYNGNIKNVISRYLKPQV